MLNWLLNYFLRKIQISNSHFGPLPNDPVPSLFKASSRAPACNISIRVNSQRIRLRTLFERNRESTINAVMVLRKFFVATFRNQPLAICLGGNAQTLGNLEKSSARAVSRCVKSKPPEARQLNPRISQNASQEKPSPAKPDRRKKPFTSRCGMIDSKYLSFLCLLANCNSRLSLSAVMLWTPGKWTARSKNLNANSAASIRLANSSSSGTRPYL